MVKAEEYILKKARSEVLFEHQGQRHGLQRAPNYGAGLGVGAAGRVALPDVSLPTCLAASRLAKDHTPLPCAALPRQPVSPFLGGHLMPAKPLKLYT